MHALSIVVPSFNSAIWLPETIGRLKIALERAKIDDYEIIVVNDGSSDGTKELLAKMRHEDGRIIAINQVNKGRFLARKVGIARASKEWVLFLDSRVYVDENALAYAERQIAKHPAYVAWNGHVRIKLGWNVFARFWDAVTFIAWRRYLHKPRLVQYHLDDFDYYPKGTGFFLAPRAVLNKYIDTFKAQIDNFKFVSDDTALLRNIARDVGIVIAPEFSCLYHSRDKLSAFMRHTLNRGTFFVDGFLQPGNRFFLPLIGFLIMSPLAVVALFVWPLHIALGLLLGWALELLAALAFGVPVASALSLWLVTPLFALLYGLGIWRGVLMLIGQRLRRSVVA